MLNRVTLIGYLGKDPEIYQDKKSKTDYGRLSLATQESWKDKNGVWQQHSEWHTVMVSGYLVNRLHKFHKGALVMASGKLRSSTYEDEDRRKVIKVSQIRAQEVKLLKPKEIAELAANDSLDATRVKNKQCK